MSRWNPIAAYSAGLAGARSDPRGDDRLADYIIRAGGNPDGAEVAKEWDFSGAGKGLLSLTFTRTMRAFPGCFPGVAQLTDDCVAGACANAIVSSLAAAGLDPGVTPKGMSHGVVARESIAAWRPDGLEGWSCSAAAWTACERGFLYRRPYRDLGLDLTRYSTDTPRPGVRWLTESRKNVVRTAAFLRGWDCVRDFVARGYGVFASSTLGFAAVRDSSGASRPEGRWAMGMAVIGYDERPETLSAYGRPLVLWLPSCGSNWNDGPRRIRGTPIDIPHGSFWATADSLGHCGAVVALSCSHGWPECQPDTPR